MGTRITLEGTELDIRASDAQAVAHYIVEMDTTADGGPVDAFTNLPGGNNLGFAIRLLPAIGSKQDFTAVQGAPNPPAVSTDPNGEVQLSFVTHTLRVSRHRIYPGGTANGNKVHADVYYQSKPRPVIELSSSAVQQKTQSYLTDRNLAGGVTTPTDPFFRQQIVLDYTQKAGSLLSAAQDASGNTTAAWPPVDIPWLKSPGEATMFRFGTSLRVSSWFFNDEATIDNFKDMASLYTACVNKGKFLFDGDDQRWLCTSLPTVTSDGGWMTRATGEFVYSPFGWDSYLYYTDPFLNSPAIVPNDVIVQLYERGDFTNSNTGVIPSSYPRQPASFGSGSSGPGAQAGVGRFPQQPCRTMAGLLGFLSQGILGTAQSLERVLNNTGQPGPQLPVTAGESGGGGGITV